MIKTYKWHLALLGAILFCSNLFSQESNKPDMNNKDERDKNPLVVAHRGDSSGAPENTIPAFELAWKNGADAIEGDFRLTKDGKIVCLHDADTQRVAGIKLAAADSTLEELRKLDVGALRDKKFQGVVIPTFEEFCATVPDKFKKVYIEIKCGPEIIPVMLESLKKTKLANDQIVVISFNQEVLRLFKEKAPQFKYNWLCSIEQNQQQTMKPTLEQILDVLQKSGAGGLSSNFQHIDQATIKAILDKGYEYHVWTVDDVKVAEKLKGWGANSVTTNNPKLIKTSLDKK